MSSTQEATRAAARAVLIGLLALPAAAAPAPQPPTAPRTGPEAAPQPQGPPAVPVGQVIPFDGVVGTIGDKAILDSRVRAELEPLIIGELNAGRRPSREQIDRWHTEYLRKIYRTEALAQAAKTDPSSSREQIDQLFEQYMREQQSEEIERAGSLAKYTEELGILGKTWESVREERRTDALAAFAEQRTLAGRFRDRLALSVTPKEMRRHYQASIDRFVQNASSDLEVVVIPGGRDGEAALARAREAREVWSREAITSADLAERFGGVALDPQLGVRDVEADPRAAAIKAFAARAAEGEVSEPQRAGSNFRLVKVARKREARHERFDDPQVQQILLYELVDQRREEMQRRLVLKGQKTFSLRQRRAKTP